MARTRPPIHGLMAEFLHAEELLAAARRAHEQGYRSLDAYSPYPVHGMAEAIGFRRNRLPMLIFIGGLSGAITAYVMMYWSAVIDYPLNVGGRPYHSWPSFIPITFELTVLFAAFSAVLGMLGLNGLPRPHHPVFNIPDFAMASRNRFFLVIQAEDGQFDLEQTRQFLEGLAPKAVFEVPW